MKKYNLTPRAKNSLRAISAYSLEKWGEQQEKKYLKALFSKFEYLANNSHIGKVRNDLLPNLKNYPEDSHIIFYLQEESSISIIDILHERMKPRLHFTND